MADLSIRDLCLRHGGETILRDLNLELRDGELLVLLGPSGCGKTSLLHAIAGLSDPASGEIWIGGQNVTHRDPGQRGVGMVFQNYALYPQMSVRGNMSFALKNAGLPRVEIAKRVTRIAQMLQIAPLLGRKPAALSGGQRQRVAIGRALVRDAGLYLFDEPLSNLDAQLRAELRMQIRSLHKSLGRTMIYVTHDQSEAQSLADRIAVMRTGRIEQLAPPDQIYARPATRFVAEFVGAPAINLFDGQLELDRGVPVFVSSLGRLPLTAGMGAGQQGGRHVVLGVRPEDIAPDPQPTAHSLNGRVAQVDVLGADAFAHLVVGGQKAVMRCPVQHRPQPGALLPIRVELARASLFDAGTGQRI